MKAWLERFIRELSRFHHYVTSVLAASLGALQYAHDNISMVQDYIDPKAFHIIAVALTISIFIAHTVERMPKD